MSLASQVFKLEELVQKGTLPTGNRPFANSLIQQWRNTRRLSQTQQLWIDKLIDKAMNPAVELPGEQKREPKGPEPVKVSDEASVFKIHEIFEHARKRDVAFPKIRFVLREGQMVKLSLAGNDSKNPGAIYIRLGETYYGKINTLGELSRYRETPCDSEIIECLRALSENPSAFGRAQGQRLKWCIFCGTTLRTNESLYYGYGPVCADNFGLEWGNSAERKDEDRFRAAVDSFQGDFFEGLKLDKI